MDANFWSWVFAAAALLVLGGVAALFTKPDQLSDKIGGTVIPIDELPTFRPLSAGVYSAVLIRQSGNLHRDLGTFPSAQAALAEAVKSFRRAKVEHVRVTHASDTELAAYRHFYNLKGRAEGKKFAGVRLLRVGNSAAVVPPSAPPRPITSYEETTLSGLHVKLLSATKLDGERYNMLVDYICGRCGSEAQPKAEVVTCTSCGNAFEPLAQVQAVQRELLRQYLQDSGVPVASVEEARKAKGSR